MKLEAWKNDQGLWNWHVRARNGNVVCQGTQGYTRVATMRTTLVNLFSIDGRVLQHLPRGTKTFVHLF